MKIKQVREKALFPMRQTKGSAGFDLHAVGYRKVNPQLERKYWGDFTPIPDCTEIEIYPDELYEFTTGWIFEIPEGYEMQMRNRSSLRLKGLMIPGGVATFDSDFRGEVAVLLKNYTKDIHSVGYGERVAQAIFAKYESFNDEISYTSLQSEGVYNSVKMIDRNEIGFGSTGRN